MNEIVRRYEKETGQKAIYRIDSADYHTLRYVQWLEATNQRLREALEDAAKSLEAIAKGAGKDEYLLEETIQIRGYANSRAIVARQAVGEGR